MGVPSDSLRNVIILIHVVRQEKPNGDLIRCKMPGLLDADERGAGETKACHHS